MGVGGWLMPSPGYCVPRKFPLPVVMEVEWTPGPVWMGVENLAPPVFDSRIVHP